MNKENIQNMLKDLKDNKIKSLYYKVYNDGYYNMLKFNISNSYKTTNYVAISNNYNEVNLVINKIRKITKTNNLYFVTINNNIEIILSKIKL